MDLNHLHLAVDDLERAKAFYRDYFGFRATAVHGKIQFMENDEGFHLALDPAYKAEPLPRWFHFGARLSTVAAVEALHARLAAGTKAVTRPLERYAGHVFFHCADPDGYKIEVYWEE
jgi:catechol 2,3-dioxygenase-like lactoylglutathione lyase family enzyme